MVGDVLTISRFGNRVAVAVPPVLSVRQITRRLTTWPAPQADTVRFGQGNEYATLYQQVQLTPKQKQVADLIQEISTQPHPKKLDQYLTVLNEPEYRWLTRIKGRNYFQTPFVDYIAKLPGLQAQTQLISKLVKIAQKPAHETARANALSTLTDLYFASQRQAMPLPTQPQKIIQGRLLHFFKNGLNTPDAKALQEQLTTHWSEWQLLTAQKLILPETAKRVRQEIVPLMTQPLAPLKTDVLPQNVLAVFEQALLSVDPALLRQMSQSGFLNRIIPEWKRLQSTANHQHSTQDYSLDEHCLLACHYAKRSPYFQKLTPAEQRVAAMASLMHDVGKETGPQNLRPIIAVDRPHPFKSEYFAQQTLPRLNFTSNEQAQIGRLLRYHQVLGALATRSTPPRPMEVEQVASLIASPAELYMLAALTEGDIRAVKFNSAWFDPQNEKNLQQVTQAVLACMQRQHQYQPIPSAQLNAHSLVQPMRIKASDPRMWLSLPALPTSQAPKDEIIDFQIHPLTHSTTANLPVGAGLLVSVTPRDIAWVSPQAPVPASQQAALNQDQAFLQVVSGLSEHAPLQALSQARSQNSALPQGPLTVFAVRPQLQGIYYRQRHPKDPVRLPAPLQQLQKRLQLPLVVIEP